MDLDGIDFAVSNFLHARSFLNAAAECGMDATSNLAAFRTEFSADVFVYPNNSMEVQGRAAVEAFEEQIGQRVRRHAIEIANSERLTGGGLKLGGCAYDSLCHFPPRRRMFLSFWGDFVEDLPAGHLVVHTVTDIYGSGDPNSSLDNLLVTIAFKRRISKALAAHLTGVLQRWASGNAIAGEGQARLASNAIEGTNTIAQLRVDFSGCGQRTVNWLILTLLDLSELHPITDVYFLSRPHPDETFEERYNLRKYKTLRYGWELGR